jgi:hypothetical protein
MESTFCTIRDDEKQHWNTLCNLVQHGTIQAAASDTAIQSKTRLHRHPQPLFVEYSNQLLSSIFIIIIIITHITLPL